MATNHEAPSSAEKRALWEVRQRYHIQHRKTAAVQPVAVVAPPSQLPPRRTSRHQPHQRRWLPRVIFFLIVIALLSGGVFGYKILAAGNKISTAERSILGQISDLFFSQNKLLAGEKDDRINLLLLAIGGEGHSGENLTDTLMILSLRPGDKSAALLSIPRDMYVKVPEESYYTKLNAIHAYGEARKKGDGPRVIKTMIEDITGLPIHYYARVDFTAFKQIVDAVGGTDITISNSFFDYWHKISFPAGREKMNGERALAYVRARYIEGPEGGDFKRAARQQQMLLALREKVFSVNTALDFGALNAILNSVADNVRTDLELWEMKRLYELARQIDRNQVHSAVLNTGPNGVLVGTTEVLGDTPASVLKTRTGDFSEIHKIALNIFSDKPLPTIETLSAPSPDGAANPTPQTSPSPSSTPRAVTVEIRNGTTVTGLAKRLSDQLSGQHYRISGIGNAVQRDAATTAVYALNNSAASAGEDIARTLKASTGASLPDREQPSDADIVIIIGRDFSAQ